VSGKRGYYVWPRAVGSGDLMSRLMKGLVALLIVVGALFFLSRMNSEKPLKHVEKPVTLNAPSQ
jgi:hypothetical protein